MLWRARGGMIHYASVLQQRCLRHWALWFEARRAKRPMRIALSRRGSLRVKRVALSTWVVAADRRAVAVLKRCAAARLAADVAIERAFASWTLLRLRRARRLTLDRRAYLFMGVRLLTKVYGGWHGLAVQRKQLGSLMPHAWRRIEALRLSASFSCWASFSASTSAAIATAAVRRSLVVAAGSRAAARALFMYAKARSRKLHALRAAAAATRSCAVARPWAGWKAAYADRVFSRTVRARLRLGFRQWAGRHARRVAYALRLYAAGRLDARALCGRVAKEWRVAAAGMARRRAISEHLTRRTERKALRGALATLAVRAELAARTDDAVAAHLLRGCTAAVARWKMLTCVANQFELEWRCAVRFKYRWMTRLVVDGWRRLLVQRHARWGVVAEAEQRFGKRRRVRALRAWRDFAVPAAAAAALSAAHAGGLRLRHCLPRWRESICHAQKRRVATRRAVSHRCSKTQAVHLNAWCEYVAVRVSRRLDKAARLASLVSALAAARLRRVHSAWVGWHTARMAQNAALAARTATFRWRLQLKALWQMQHYTVYSRVRDQSQRAADIHAARQRLRLGMATWRVITCSQHLYRRDEDKAAAMHNLSLTRSCWHGMLRYHARQQMKSSQIRQAYDEYRMRLTHLGVTQWLAVGLARHEHKLQAAADRAAHEAGESLRRAEKFARRWRAVAAQKRRGAACAIQGGGGSPRLISSRTRAGDTSLEQGLASMEKADAQAHTLDKPHEPRRTQPNSLTSPPGTAERLNRHATRIESSAERDPYRLEATGGFASALAAAVRSVPSVGDGADELTRFLPEARTRKLPRQLPIWMQAHGESTPVALSSPQPQSLPHQPVHSGSSLVSRPPPSCSHSLAGQFSCHQNQHGSQGIQMPPPSPPLSRPPCYNIAETLLTLTPASMRPATHPAPLLSAPQPADEFTTVGPCSNRQLLPWAYVAAHETTSTGFATPGCSPAASCTGDESRADHQISALNEVRAIERQLRQFAEEKAKFDASCALHAQLSAQLRRFPAQATQADATEEALPSLQREAALEELRRVASQLAQYEGGRDERQQAVTALMRRIKELRKICT